MSPTRRAALVLAAASLFAAGCGVPGPRTTAAWDARPPATIGIELPVDRTGTPGAAEAVHELWTEALASRGWELLPADGADAVLRSTIETWNWQSGSDTAIVAVEARLERRSDGELLWRGSGRGSDCPDVDDDDDRGLLDSTFDWAFDQAAEGLARPLGLSTRDLHMRQAARDGLAESLRTLPLPGRARQEAR